MRHTCRSLSHGGRTCTMNYESQRESGTREEQRPDLEPSHHVCVYNRISYNNRDIPRSCFLFVGFLGSPISLVAPVVVGCRPSGEFTDRTASPRLPFPVPELAGAGFACKGGDWLPFAWKSSAGPGIWCFFQGPLQRAQATQAILGLVNASIHRPCFAYYLSVPLAYPPRLEFHLNNVYSSNASW